MSNRIYFSIIICAFLTITNAQEVLLSSQQYPEMQNLGISGNVFLNEYQQVRGSAFLIDDWTNGDLYLKNGKSVKNVSLKFDMYTHEVHLYHNILKRVVVLDKKEINMFVLHQNNKERIFKRMANNSSKAYASNGAFMEIFNDGKLSFYKISFNEKVVLSAPVKPYIYEFVNKKEYKLSYNSKETTIKPGRRALIKLFPEKKQELKQYIRKSHLKLSNENDFAKTVEYLNETFE